EPTRAATFVRQQNLSAGTQQVAYVEKTASPKKKGRNNKKGTTRKKETSYAAPVIQPVDLAPEPQKVRGRQTQSREARPANRGRAHQAAGSGPENPALAAHDRPEDAGR